MSSHKFVARKLIAHNSRINECSTESLIVQLYSNLFNCTYNMIGILFCFSSTHDLVNMTV